MTNFALNPFKKGKKAQIEKVQDVEVDNSGIEKALAQYEIMKRELTTDINTQDYISSLDDINMSPNSISVLLNHIISNNLFEGDRRNAGIVGKYISKLVQDSFNNGNNNFKFYTNDVIMDNFCTDICGKVNRKLHILLNGDVIGHRSCSGNYTNFTINGNVGNSFAELSKNSKYLINGYCGDDFASHSNKSVFVIYGSVGDLFANTSYKSKFKVYGNTGWGCGKHSCYSEFLIDGNVSSHCGVGSSESNFILKKNASHLGKGSNKSIFLLYGDHDVDREYHANESTFKFFKESSYDATCENYSFNDSYMAGKRHKPNIIQLLGPNGEVLKEVRK